MLAVRFEDVSKRFVIHHERSRTFQEAAMNLVRLRRVNGRHEEFWALRDVSFAVERGRTLGVIGRNGSGKSTLLKLLAGTMRPTSGEIVAHGRVFGLLELAAGFHPELSGRENVFLNGTFLGLSRKEMARRLDEIVAFSELEQFIDTPVKHYSSGMYMRLGFAIAISVDPDILVIDEVLAVGDAAFRQKCFMALADFKARQKTILFVTHDPAAVRRFCDEAVWLDRGQIRATGPAADVLRDYLQETQSSHGGAIATAGPAADPLSAPAGPVELLGAEIVDAGGVARTLFAPGDTVGVRVRFRAAAATADVSFGVGLHRDDGIYVNGTSTAAAGYAASVQAGEGTVTCWLDDLPLSAAAYTVTPAVWCGASAAPAQRLSRAARFSVAPCPEEQAGLLALRHRWEAAGAAALASPERGDGTPAGADAGDIVDDAGPISQPARADAAPIPEAAFRARWRRPPARVIAGQEDDEFLGAGWYPPEDWPPRIRWTSTRATAYLTQDEWTSLVGVTMCRPQHGSQPATGRIYVDGRIAGRFEVASPALEPFTFPVEPVDAPREVEITLEIDGALEPSTTGASDDPRALGVAVRELWLE
jgi:lipopolysaccharide transport system ATP-binding protein